MQRKSAETLAETEQRIIVAGFGGQGILTLGKLLCMSALGEGRRVTYLPSYGTEVRGGTANCQVTISPGDIYNPLVEAADSLVILNQLSYERFADRLLPGGTMLLNSSLIDSAEGQGPKDAEVLSLPAAEMAAELGSVQVTNIIMLGAFLEVVPVVRPAAALEAIRDLLGKKKEEMLELNERAFEEGRRRLAESRTAK
jgi:2-oxoglutarate ferredoxin oxidoreductase subunit gamma